jgi:hypothetical protein
MTLMHAKLAIFFTLCLSTICSAVPITLIHEGSGSGVLGGIPFNDVDFVITATADTANRVSIVSDAYSTSHDSAQIELLDLGTFDFVTSTRTFVNLDLALVGFSRFEGGTDLFNGPNDPILGTWDMLTSTGPLSGEGYLTQWEESNGQVITSGGVLEFFSSSVSPATFTAVVGIPEPSSIMLAAGSLGLFALRRQR